MAQIYDFQFHRGCRELYRIGITWRMALTAELLRGGDL